MSGLDSRFRTRQEKLFQTLMLETYDHIKSVTHNVTGYKGERRFPRLRQRIENYAPAAATHTKPPANQRPQTTAPHSKRLPAPPNGRHNPPNRKTNTCPNQNLRRFGRVHATVGRSRAASAMPVEKSLSTTRLLLPSRFTSTVLCPTLYPLLSYIKQIFGILFSFKLVIHMSNICKLPRIIWINLSHSTYSK
jgi:hypothetical protein